MKKIYSKSSKPKKATAKDYQQDKRIAKIEKVLSTVELKYVDTVTASAIPTWNGTVVNMNVPSSGTGDGARIGDRVTIKRVEFKWNCGYIATALQSNTVRVMLVQDKAGSLGTVPGNILDNGVFAGANAAQGPIEEDYKNQMIVHYDTIFTLDTVSKLLTRGQFTKSFKRGLPLTFVSNSTVVSGGQFKVLIISDAAAPNLIVDHNLRYWYSDM